MFFYNPMSSASDSFCGNTNSFKNSRKAGCASHRWCFKSSLHKKESPSSNGQSTAPSAAPAIPIDVRAWPPPIACRYRRRSRCKDRRNCRRKCRRKCKRKRLRLRLRVAFAVVLGVGAGDCAGPLVPRHVPVLAGRVAAHTRLPVFNRAMKLIKRREKDPLHRRALGRAGLGNIPPWSSMVHHSEPPCNNARSAAT